MSPPPLLLATGVTKRFGPVLALDDVDLRVETGEIISLAGENGSGKSTFARILAGVFPPDAGELVLAGEPVRFGRPRDALDAGVALVSQEPTAIPGLSVAENVLLPRLQRSVRRVRRRQLERDAVPHLERVGLRVDPRRPFASLAQGERELVEIARAVALEPRLLVLDEATTRMPDPERLFAVVEDLAAGGTSVIFITHRLQEMHRLAHRVVVLRDGRNAGELERPDFSDQRISSMMVGRELTEFFHKAEVQLQGPALELRALVTERSAHPIDLTVSEGEIVGLAGLVGAGRSELLETIAGARSPRGGEIRVASSNVPQGSPRAAIRAGIGFVPEDRWAQGLIRHASVVANVTMARPVLSRTDRAGDNRRAQEAVDRFRVRCSSIRAPVATLSGGNAQKVVLARALATEPKVLLLDEPTRGVDVGAKAEIYKLVAEMVTRRVGVLVASSDLMELLGLCDRVIVLHDGVVAGELARDEATEETLALLSAGGGTS